MKKTIITAALTGALTTRKQCPAIPYTPQEIAIEAKRAVSEGASIVHIHARKDDGSPAWGTEIFSQIDNAVYDVCSDVIINYSTGAIGLSKEERIAHISDVCPDIAALNMGSMNYAIYSSKHKKFYHDHVFANPFADICFFLQKMNAANTRPELECFDCGHISNTQPLIDMGILKPPYQFSFIMGVLGGIPATTRNLVHQMESLPANSLWQVVGVGLKQWPMIAAAITLEGNIRVGLEDNFYLQPGKMAQSNGELVAKAARLVRDLGGEVASVEEAREILGIRRKNG